jgi:hypothetical protein
MMKKLWDPGQCHWIRNDKQQGPGEVVSQNKIMI